MYSKESHGKYSRAKLQKANSQSEVEHMNASNEISGNIN